MQDEVVGLPEAVAEGKRPQVLSDHQLEYPVVGSSVPYRFTPTFHVSLSSFSSYMLQADGTLQFQENLDWWRSVDSAIRADYVSNLPTYISRPELSSIKCLTHVEYEQLSPSQVAVILKDKNILIHGIPHTPVEFGWRSLKRLGRIDRQMTIHGEPLLHAMYLLTF